jgi:signal transduction histidine kinase
MPLIIVCRFIPGGRTAVMLCCGIVGYQRRRFVIATAISGVIWASYSFFIGRLGGKAFEDKPWAGLLLALGLTLAVSAVIEVVRRIRSRHGAGRARGQAPATRQGDTAAAQSDAAAERHDAAERQDVTPERRDAAVEQHDTTAEQHDATPGPGHEPNGPRTRSDCEASESR